MNTEDLNRNRLKAQSITAQILDGVVAGDEQAITEGWHIIASTVQRAAKDLTGAYSRVVLSALLTGMDMLLESQAKEAGGES